MDIGKTIIDTTENIRNLQKDFSSFTSYNEMFVMFASAICVGMATRDMVSDIMNETLLPLVLFISQRGITYLVYTKLLEKTTTYPTLKLVIQHIAKLAWIVLVWILTLYLVYLIFKKLIKLDLITDKVDLVQGVTGYLMRKEPPKLHSTKQETYQETQRPAHSFIV